ncbi:MAG: flagellar hook-basal body complex protein [Planctomycetota bacterium]|nr:flagellar hook-basal body complex protein [Planctomycetota bacterium]
MASTQALLTGLTGLNAASRTIEVAGNNISNSNTTAFKSSRALFSNLFSRTLAEGTEPGEILGGTNPHQIGYGVQVAGTQRLMGSGTISNTGNARDLAIDGEGFFVVGDGDSQYFTRAGAFQQNAEYELVTPGGERLLGYAVDSSFQVVTSELTPITIPLGGVTIAEQSTRVRFSGNLNASGDTATQGAIVQLQGTETGGLRTIASATPPPAPGNLVENTTRLVDLEDPDQPTTNAPLFEAGQVIELRNLEKGQKTLPRDSLTITDATTLEDLATFLSNALRLSTDAGDNPDGETPGVSIDANTGRITIVGNTGTVNDLTIDVSDIRLLSATGGFVRSPFAVGKAQSATGESVRTTTVVYDSLGTPIEMDLSIVLESRSSAGTTWRYYAESPDDSDASGAMSSGTLTFDTDGQLATTTPASVTIDRAGVGAGTPIGLSLFFSQGRDVVTALTDTRSEIAATFRDGAPIGTLENYAFGVDGVITGSFSNGLTRTLGQVALAKFSNPAGLVDLGNSLFTVAANSGTPQITTPGTLGTGNIVGGALEQSNVDLGQEFINLILASTGYSASSRVVRTADELLQQLLVIGR